MSKVVQAFLSGLFFTFLLDFLLFLDIFLNYIKPLEIELYYNVLFADNQNIIIFLLFTTIIGYLITYVKSSKITFSIIFTFFLFVGAGLIPQVGYKFGEVLLMKKDVVYKDAKHTFVGNVYYNGRKSIIFYDSELKKAITLEKSKLIKR